MTFLIIYLCGLPLMMVIAALLDGFSGGQRAHVNNIAIAIVWPVVLPVVLLVILACFFGYLLDVVYDFGKGL